MAAEEEAGAVALGPAASARMTAGGEQKAPSSPSPLVDAPDPL